MRSVPLVALLAVACEGRPDRPPLDEFLGAVDDTGLLLDVNSCQERNYAFKVESRRAVENVVRGYGTFVYEPDVQRSTITLHGCGENRGVTISLPFYGVARLRRGPHEVHREADVEGGFLFTYVDAREGREMRCSDKPEGSVVVTRANERFVGGRFDVTVGCLGLEDVYRDIVEPRPARFHGHFRALDVADPLDLDF